MAAVAFSYASWVARYPEFTAVAEPTALLYFQEAGIYLDNTDSSPVREEIRAPLLYMLTSHIAFLAKAEGEGSAPAGRIASATEGTVSVSTASLLPGTAEWFALSSYGLAYWQATARYRTARYFAPSIPRPQPFDYSRHARRY